MPICTSVVNRQQVGVLWSGQVFNVDTDALRHGTVFSGAPSGSGSKSSASGSGFAGGRRPSACKSSPSPLGCASPGAGRDGRSFKNFVHGNTSAHARRPDAQIISRGP